MSTLRMQLLNNFQLSCDGVPVTTINQARMQALLAYLILHRDTLVSRQHLAFLFWPDTSEAQAHTNLRQLLHHLRRVWPMLGDFVQIEARRLQWKPTAICQLDVIEFEAAIARATETMQSEPLGAARTALAEAADLYAGDLLPACYEEWLLPERERLRQHFLDALAQLVMLCERARDYALAIRYAQRLLRADPLHETTYQQLMRLYALNGDRASALRTYHTCTSVLSRELGVEPNVDTQEVYARLLKLERPPPAESAAGTDGGERLVGRQAEWEKLQAAWQTANRGHAHFVCISGEAGIGKTRLAEELLTWARQQGITIAHTRSYAAEGDLAYAPVIEWLRSEALQATLIRLEPVWRAELARLLPELLMQQPILPHPEALPERWQRQRLFEALTRAILSGELPLLLVIDDLQWVDPETLEWLRYLLRFDPKARLLIVGTLRPEEVDNDHALTTLLLQLRSAGQVTEFELPRLDAAETATLAAQMAGQPLDATITKHLYQQTEGNPLFVVEMVRAAWRRDDITIVVQDSPAKVSTLSALPPKVHAVIQARLSQLSPPARTLTALAAVIGRAFTFDELAQAGEDDQKTLVQALDELWKRRIVREQGSNAYDFSHDRIREVAYAEMSTPRRRFLHQRVAQALVALYSDQDTTISGQLAFHYEQAQLLEEALRCYRQAADASANRYAFADALLEHERVLVLIEKLPNAKSYRQEQIASWLQIAQIITYLKGWTAIERKQALERAYNLIQPGDDQRWLYDVLRGLRVYYANIGDWYMAFDYSQEALRVAEATQDLHYLCRAYQGIATAYLQRGEPITSLHYFRKIRDVEARLGTTYQPDVTSRARMAEALWLTGYPEQARLEAAEALRLAEEQRHPHGQVHARDLVMFVYQRLADLPALSRLTIETNTLAEQFGFPNYVAAARFIAGWAIAQRGSLQAGLQQMIEALAALEQIEERFNLPYLLALLAQVQAQNGQIELALQTIAQALQEAEKSGDRLWQAELVRLTGEFHQLLQDEARTVAGLYRSAHEIARQQDAKSLELRAAISLARLEYLQSKDRKVDNEAHRLLAEIYDWFTEGFDTLDLQAAKALLEELNQSA